MKVDPVCDGWVLTAERMHVYLAVVVLWQVPSPERRSAGELVLLWRILSRLNVLKFMGSSDAWARKASVSQATSVIMETFHTELRLLSGLYKDAAALPGRGDRAQKMLYDRTLNSYYRSETGHLLFVAGQCYILFLSFYHWIVLFMDSFMIAKQ